MAILHNWRRNCRKGVWIRHQKMVIIIIWRNLILKYRERKGRLLQTVQTGLRDCCGLCRLDEQINVENEVGEKLLWKMQTGCTDYCWIWRLGARITVEEADYENRLVWVMEIGCTDYCGKWRLEKDITLDYGERGTVYCICCSRRTQERVTKSA